VDADTLGGISCPVDGDTVKFVAGTWVCDSRLNDVVADLYTGNVSDAVPYWNGTDWETGATGLYNDGLGTVSVGTVAAGTNLEVYGNFSLVNGTEGAGRVLSSDANGNASWVTNLSVAPAVVADFGVGYTGNSPSNEATGTSITLPPGKWSVQVTMLIAPTVTPTSTEAAWVRLHLSDTAGGVGTADTIPGAGGMVSGAVTGPSPYAVASGSIVLENIGPASKTYHLTKGPQANVGGYDINFSGLGGSGWGENAMIAYPMN
jgi:hypothetical protein